MDRNPPITAHEHDLLTPLRSAAVTDVCEERNSWLNVEPQSPHVIERRSNVRARVGLKLFVCISERE